MTKFWDWVRENLCVHDVSFENQFFDAEIELYSCRKKLSIPEHFRRMEETFTRRNLYAAVMKACGTHKLQKDALWFHVNVIDQAVWSEEEYRKYPYPLSYSEQPLEILFKRMEKFPAAQAGTTYVGLIDERKKWLLLLEKSGYSRELNQADFQIRFFGSQSLCKTARSFLKQKVD